MEAAANPKDWDGRQLLPEVGAVAGPGADTGANPNEDWDGMELLPQGGAPAWLAEGWGGAQLVLGAVEV